ncbi:hypothetical protein EV121DRAFT_218278 [Schizophyllum commune]
MLTIVQGKALTTRDRPAFVHAWIQRARKDTYVPDLLADRKAGESDDDAANAAYDKFRKNMSLWWRNINPTWRESTPSFALARHDGDWAALYRPGKNGLISVVKCMKWWWDLLEDVDEEESDRSEWRAALEDVIWTFEQVLNHQKQ